MFTVICVTDTILPSSIFTFAYVLVSMTEISFWPKITGKSTMVHNPEISVSDIKQILMLITVNGAIDKVMLRLQKCCLNF